MSDELLLDMEVSKSHGLVDNLTGALSRHNSGGDTNANSANFNDDDHDYYVDCDENNDETDRAVDDDGDCDEEAGNETVIQVVRPSRDDGSHHLSALVMSSASLAEDSCGGGASGEEQHGAAAVGVARSYLQKFRPQWQQEPMFRDWLLPVPGDPYSAACRFCQTTLCAHRKLLVLHCTSKKHLQRCASVSATATTTSVTVSTSANYTPERRVLRGRGRSRSARTARASAAPYTAPSGTAYDRSMAGSNSGGASHCLAAVSDNDDDDEARLDTAYSDPCRLTYAPAALPLTQRVGFVGADSHAQLVARGLLERGVVAPEQLLVAAVATLAVVPLASDVTTDECHVTEQRQLEVWRSWGCQIAAAGAAGVDQVMCHCDLVFVAVAPGQLAPIVSQLSVSAFAAARAIRQTGQTTSSSSAATAAAAIHTNGITSSTSWDESTGQCIVSLVSGVARCRLVQLLADRWATIGRNHHQQQQQQEQQQQLLPPARRMHVVRCEVSAGAMVGDGCCLYTACGSSSSSSGGGSDGGVPLPAAWQLTVETLLSTLGVCQRVDSDRLLDAAGAVCGAGTAFALTFIEALAAGAVNVGVAWPMARALATQTTLGAARLLVETGRTAHDLGDQLSTPGGAAIAGQMALERHGLRHAVMSAVEAAAQRIQHLATPTATPTSRHCTND